MYRISRVILSVLVVVKLSTELSLPTDSFYHAGVVEFRPSYKLTISARVTDNLQGYIDILASKEAESLDIIVFPESTLNSNDESTFVPNPLKSMSAPCDSLPGEYHNILVQLSCAARNHSMYVVINLSEKELCSSVPEDTRPCANSGLNIFNTNVVFDRSGVVISRYRKVHLYGENRNSTFIPEFGWFDTDFGVRFGHFVCFDILFYSPAQELVEKYNIKDFIFPTMWFSQLPFLTAVQFHQAWSYANDVNFLAAGASYPPIGTTGSSIYNGRNGVLVSSMNLMNGERRLYKTQVPKYAQVQHRTKRSSLPVLPQKTKLNITLKRDLLQSYETVLIDLFNQTKLSQELCFTNNSLCCQFDLQWQQLMSHQQNLSYYHYRLSVFDGQRHEDGIESNQLKNCAVFSCTGTDILDCGKMFDIETDVVFENITITAKFPRTKTYLLMPNSVRAADLMPVPVNNFEWHETREADHYVRVRYSLNTSTKNIMAFSIYGNYYDSVFAGESANGNEGGDGASCLSLSIACMLYVLLSYCISS